MRGLGIILSGTLGAGVALAGTAGYLPRVGPAPLRFQSPQSASRVLLPPLEMLDAPVPPAQESNQTTNQLADLGPLLFDPEINDLSMRETNSLNAAATNLPSPDFNSDTNAVISPQMLLRFFSRSGAGTSRETVVVPPPSFTPARPGQPASSSATYSSPKP